MASLTGQSGAWGHGLLCGRGSRLSSSCFPVHLQDISMDSTHLDMQRLPRVKDTTSGCCCHCGSRPIQPAQQRNMQQLKILDRAEGSMCRLPASQTCTATHRKEPAPATACVCLQRVSTGSPTGSCRAPPQRSVFSLHLPERRSRPSAWCWPSWHRWGPETCPPTVSAEQVGPSIRLMCNSCVPICRSPQGPDSPCSVYPTGRPTQPSLSSCADQQALG